MKLTGKILMLLLVVVVLITSVASMLSVQAAYADLEQRQQTLARELAIELKDRLAAAWRQSGPRGVTLAVREWSVEGDRPVSVHWVVFREDATSEVRPRAPRSSWASLERGQIFSVVSNDERGQRRLHMYLPMFGFTGEVSALEFTQPLAELDQQTRQVVFNSLVSIIASALIGLILAYVAGIRWVARPLQALILQTERIGRGQFDEKLSLDGGDELDQLARALNAMSDRLSHQQSTIARETQERLAALQQLRHVDRLGTLGRMAAGIAHELGTPLNVVAGRAALIASKKLSDEEVTNSALTIKSEADRITSIVQRLLDFARGRKPQRIKGELKNVVQRSIQLLEPLAEKHNVRLDFQQPKVPTFCMIDESQMQQVITNLIVNAVHAASHTGGIIHLTIELLPSGRSANDSNATRTVESVPESKWLRLRVEDNGPGVPSELRERIFEPFFTTKDVGEGTGLGLSIAYGIVQEHGGQLEVSTGALGGAAFDVLLPFSDPAGDSIPQLVEPRTNVPGTTKPSANSPSANEPDAMKFDAMKSDAK